MWPLVLHEQWLSFLYFWAGSSTVSACSIRVGLTLVLSKSSFSSLSVHHVHKSFLHETDETSCTFDTQPITCRASLLKQMFYFCVCSHSLCLYSWETGALHDEMVWPKAQPHVLLGSLNRIIQWDASNWLTSCGRLYK